MYEGYRNVDPWEKNVPADLLPAIKHLRRAFDDYHWQYGWTTQRLCYWKLHPELPKEHDIEEYVKPLQQIKGIAGAESTQRFVALLKLGTLPSIFKAFFDLYMDCITLAALGVFTELMAIGRVNEQRLDAPHLEWAANQSKNMIRSKIHLIELWVRNVCDKHQPDPGEDDEERIFWRRWPAPMFLVMRPSRYMAYDPSRAWERNDSETSQSWLKMFAEQYVLNSEAKLGKLAGQAALSLAKQPPLIPQTSASTPVPQNKVAGKTDVDIKPRSAQREIRKIRKRPLLTVPTSRSARLS